MIVASFVGLLVIGFIILYVIESRRCDHVFVPVKEREITGTYCSNKKRLSQRHTVVVERCKHCDQERGYRTDGHQKISMKIPLARHIVGRD